MKCASRSPLLSATAYCYVRTVHGRPTSALCRQLIAKLSGITEWYKNGTTRSQNPYAAGFTEQKLYVRQIGVSGIMVGYCVLLKFQFAY